MHQFDRAYLGTPPWDIGRAQPEFVRLEREGEIVGRVLDLGCGTGENALFFAAHGHESWGIDFASAAVAQARQKAEERRVPARFERADALALAEHRERFDTVIDCGLFHTFADPHRTRYAESVRQVLRPEGRLFVLCFSEEEPADWGGPRRVTKDELRATFAPELEPRWIRRARFETRLGGIEGRAWLAAFRRR